MIYGSLYPDNQYELSIIVNYKKTQTLVKHSLVIENLASEKLGTVILCITSRGLKRSLENVVDC